MAAKKSGKEIGKKSTLALSAELRLSHAGNDFLGGRRIALLEGIAQHGSITRAAKAIKLSYKAAWDILDAMNNLAERPLVIRAVGGRAGGGTRLTEYGQQLIQVYRQLQAGQQRVLGRLQSRLHNAAQLNEVLQSLGLRTSARNQLRGTIKRITKGAVNADVILDLGDGLQIVANITNASVTDLGLRRGIEAIALIKSSFVLLSPDLGVRISADNRLAATITAIVPGKVNSEVKLQLASARTLVAIITNLSLGELQLRPGAAVCAVINASHVLIAVNH